jgi:hypothetical protein
MIEFDVTFTIVSILTIRKIVISLLFYSLLAWLTVDSSDFAFENNTVTIILLYIVAYPGILFKGAPVITRFHRPIWGSGGIAHSGI